MDLDERLLPQEIKQLEKGPKWKRPYSTHMVGKWHLGNCDKKFLPHNRGFDSFYGIYGGAVNYYNKTKKLGGVPFVDYFDREEPVRNWSEKNLPRILSNFLISYFSASRILQPLNLRDTLHSKLKNGLFWSY